ncbi:MAG: GH32 C-terminal domain-containing protein [Paludibacter sp.]|nr:GH32 C-terminal domain-containing protein [Paludibacter sp.]
MKTNLKLITLFVGLFIGNIQLNAKNLNNSVDQTLVAFFPMEVTGNVITETVSGNSFLVQNNFNKPENVPGAVGNALRLDGYSTFCNAQINATVLSQSALTVSLWCALETNPMMDPNNNVTTETYIAGNMDDNLKTGFAFTLNATGNYAFEVYVDGTKITCSNFNEILPVYEWEQLVATVNSASKEVNLYRNGQLISSSYFFGKGVINSGGNSFIIGKSFANTYADIFRTNTINGLIDDISIFSRVLTRSELVYSLPQNAADLSIPKSRHQNDFQRPEFHGLPATNWTNEPHGLVYFNSKYHIFFQKNANGPYWGKLHWGHITSDDLLNWKEEKIALSNTNSYDMKGNWSGCVFTDEVLTGGKPNIFYTGVDYAKASINQAEPVADDLINWNKDIRNPIIPNRPAGLSDDFRDPYVFKSNGDFYLIAGTSRNGLGAATLHKFDQVTKTWSNDGRIFYQAINTGYGFFWEMPVIVPMPDGKWLFLVTTLGGNQGVETLYWVGTINSDGTFNPFSATPKEVELGIMGSNGYGLLSPSIMQKDGKTIAIGIVPDKLPSNYNLQLGWAHLYSLPREWTLDANNNLIQQPYSGTQNMRDGSSAFSSTNLDVSGSISLAPVSGKALEIDGNFIVSAAVRFGFHVRKKDTNFISVHYTPSTNKFTIDAQNVTRLSNDAGSFNGLYESVLPQKPALGETMRIHIFIDHSIMDIFINNQFAFSIRVFPTDSSAEDVEAFSDGGTTTASSIQAWKLNSALNSTGVSSPTIENNIKVYSNGDNLIYENVPYHSDITVYNLQGQKIISQRYDINSGKIELTKNQIYIVKIKGDNVFFSKKILM